MNDWVADWWSSEEHLLLRQPMIPVDGNPRSDDARERLAAKMRALMRTNLLRISARVHLARRANTVQPDLAGREGPLPEFSMCCLRRAAES